MGNLAVSVPSFAPAKVTETAYSPGGKGPPSGAPVSLGPFHCLPGQSMVPVLVPRSSVMVFSACGAQHPVSHMQYRTSPAPMDQLTNDVGSELHDAHTPQPGPVAV